VNPAYSQVFVSMKSVFLRLVSSGKKQKASRYGTHVVSRSGLAHEDHAPDRGFLTDPVLTTGSIEPGIGFNRLLPTAS